MGEGRIQQRVTSVYYIRKGGVLQGEKQRRYVIRAQKPLYFHKNTDSLMVFSKETIILNEMQTDQQKRKKKGNKTPDMRA